MSLSLGSEGSQGHSGVFAQDLRVGLLMGRGFYSGTTKYCSLSAMLLLPGIAAEDSQQREGFPQWSSHSSITDEL